MTSPRSYALPARSTAVEDGAEMWITAKPGFAGRELPQGAVWLRAGDYGKRVFDTVTWDGDWRLEVIPRGGDDDRGWEETIVITEDQRTAMHLVRHPALDADHVVVHGADTAGAVAALRAAGEFTVVDGLPAP